MHVASPPTSPTLLYDGGCGFCRRWVARLAESAPGVVTRPCQDARDTYPEIPEEACRRSVQWIEPDGEVVSGADAATRYWAQSSRFGRAIRWGYDRLPGFAAACETGYRLVAASRPVASPLSRWLWGEEMGRPRFRIAGDLFLRALGLIYAIAFLSLAVQVEGLIGERGILPAHEMLGAVGERYGISAGFQFPSVFWLGSSDTLLLAACLLGALAGLAGTAVPYVWLPWIISWSLYLSFVSVGRSFLSFQWDALLLEAGFLAVVHTLLHARGLASGSERPPYAFSAAPRPHGAVAWAYRWLLFRLMFSSGIVKLTSGDPAWWNLTALRSHFETQPLPNLVAWYAHHLPPDVHTLSCVVMFVIEIGVPFLFFAPRRPRHFAALCTVALQILILLTGNYTFFNLLTIALCLWLVEDAAWPRAVTDRFRRRIRGSRPNALRRLAGPAVALHLILSAMLLTRGALRADIRFPAAVHAIYGVLAPFRVLNTYGLFAVMTTERPEIILEGSSNGTYWETYEFYYKPGDVNRPPPFVAPHQPRLDWQMWFAALGPPRNSPWFHRFLQRLFEGSEPVRKLLAQDPFPDDPPRFLRARLFDYRFSTPEERAATGAWWSRTYTRNFLPPVVRTRR